MNRIFDKPRGQIAFLYAGALAFALVGALAMGTDVAVMYVNWQHSQKTVDAAAIAGATYLNGQSTYADPATGTAYPTSTGCAGVIAGSTAEAVATQVACTYAVKNGLDAANVTITPTVVSPTLTTIQVAANETTFPYFFGKALGLGNYTVQSSATSQGGGTVQTVLGSVNTTTTTNLGLVPLGLQCDTPCAPGALVAGEPVSFGNKFLTSVINCTPGVGTCSVAGNWGWLDLDGSGGSTLKNNLGYGSPGTFTVGQVINTDPGQKTGPIKQGLDTRFAGCPSIADPCTGGSTANIPAGDPCLVVVPAVDFSLAQKNGNTNLTIEAFAEVYLDPTTTDSTHINGCFVSAVAGGTLSTTTTTTTTTGPTTTFLGSTAPPTLTN